MIDEELLLAIKQIVKTEIQQVVKAEIAPLESRLTALEQKVDEHLRETKPIWERALKEIMELGQGLKRIEDELSRLTTQLRILNQDMLRLRADQARLEERLDRIENASAPIERT